MIPFILKLQRHVNTLLERLTADRASYLDAPISESGPLFYETKIIFESSGTVTLPANRRSHIFAVGGGGSGGVFRGNSSARARGGNGGDTVYATVTPSSDTDITVTLGAGGSGVTRSSTGGTSGNTGGVTTVTGAGLDVSASGGRGGSANPSDNISRQDNASSSGGFVIKGGRAGGVLVSGASGGASIFEADSGSAITGTNNGNTGGAALGKGLPDGIQPGAKRSSNYHLLGIFPLEVNDGGDGGSSGIHNDYGGSLLYLGRGTGASVDSGGHLRSDSAGLGAGSGGVKNDQSSSASATSGAGGNGFVLIFTELL